MAKWEVETGQSSLVSCESCQVEIEMWKASNAAAIKLYEDLLAAHCLDLSIGIRAALESQRRAVLEALEG